MNSLATDLIDAGLQLVKGETTTSETLDRLREILNDETTTRPPEPQENGWYIPRNGAVQFLRNTDGKWDGYTFTPDATYNGVVYQINEQYFFDWPTLVSHLSPTALPLIPLDNVQDLKLTYTERKNNE